MWSPETLAVCATSGLVVVVHATIQVLPLLRDAWARPGSSFFLWWRSLCSSADAEGCEEEQRWASHWNKLLLDSRIEYFLGIQRIAMHICTFFSWRVVVRMAIGETIPARVVQSSVCALIVFTHVLTRGREHLVTRRVLWMMHTWYMALITVGSYSFAYQDMGGDNSMGPTVFAVRVAIAMAYPEVLPNLFWSVLWGVMSCALQLASLSTCWAPPTFLSLVFLELFRVAVFTFLTRQVQLLQIRQVRSEVKAAGHMREKGKMESILQAMCDAVVELGADLRIKTSSPRLASLLLRHTNATQLRGEIFTDMIHGQPDCDRFNELIAPQEMAMDGDEEDNRTDGASNLYLNLRDSNGTPVPVQLFHKCYQDITDEICHVVGVREVEQEPEREDQGTANSRVQLTTIAQGSLDDALSDADSNVSFSSAGTNETIDGGAVFVPILPDQEAKAAVSVVFDGLRGDIIGCTAGFASQTGPLICSKAHMRNVIGDYQTSKSGTGYKQIG